MNSPNKIFCIELWEPLSSDKRTKPAVHVKLVAAASVDEAVRAVAKHDLSTYPNHVVKAAFECDDGEVLTWKISSRDRSDYPRGNSNKTVKELA